MLAKLKAFWRGLPDWLRRILHTAWQVGLPVLVSNLYLARSSADVKGAFIAAGAVFLASIKASIVGRS